VHKNHAEMVKNVKGEHTKVFSLDLRKFLNQNVTVKIMTKSMVVSGSDCVDHPMKELVPANRVECKARPENVQLFKIEHQRIRRTSGVKEHRHKM